MTDERIVCQSWAGCCYAKAWKYRGLLWCRYCYADPDSIDNAIDAWHEDPGRESLAEWLGMTEDQYKHYAEGG